MTDLYYNGKKVTEKEMQELLNQAAMRQVAESESIKVTANVSEDTADAIMYLRTRSRWTLEKEQELIDRDHAGDPIPLMDVLSGEF